MKRSIFRVIALSIASAFMTASIANAQASKTQTSDWSRVSQLCPAEADNADFIVNQWNAFAEETGIYRGENFYNIGVHTRAGEIARSGVSATYDLHMCLDGYDVYNQLTIDNNQDFRSAVIDADNQIIVIYGVMDLLH